MVLRKWNEWCIPVLKVTKSVTPLEALQSDLKMQPGIGFVLVRTMGAKIKKILIASAATSVEVTLHNLKREYLLISPQNALFQPNIYYDMEQLQEAPFEQYKALLYFENSPGM